MNSLINPLSSINFHLWPYCNFNCKYCFARFDNINQTLKKSEYIKIIKELTENGTIKLNFAGGEPTLYSFLGDLIGYSKKLGLITSIISNGTRITPKFVKKFGEVIDWIGLSLDSGNEKIQQILGRGNGNYVQSIIHKSSLVKGAGIKLKINSVITRLNYHEDMSWVIKKIEPDRWKVFQILGIQDQNTINLNGLKISRENFNQFLKRHKYLNPVAEDNESMIESYVMIDPLGRFYQNSGYTYTFSRPILEVGILNAFNDIQYNYLKFFNRGGFYAW